MCYIFFLLQFFPLTINCKQILMILFHFECFAHNFFPNFSLYFLLDSPQLIPNVLTMYLIDPNLYNIYTQSSIHNKETYLNVSKRIVLCTIYRASLPPTIHRRKTTFALSRIDFNSLVITRDRWRRFPASSAIADKLVKLI